jgi:hypothetical protein
VCFGRCGVWLEAGRLAVESVVAEQVSLIQFYVVLRSLIVSVVNGMLRDPNVQTLMDAVVWPVEVLYPSPTQAWKPPIRMKISHFRG